MNTISFDLDNTIRDQIGSIIEATRRQFGTQLERRMFDRWDPPVGQYVGLDETVFTRWAWTDPMLVAQARPFSGVKNVLRRLRLAGHRVIITTATGHPGLTGPWLAWWGLEVDEVIHTQDKAQVAFDYHVDDSPHTLEALAGAGRRVIRFALPWNRHLTQFPAMESWDWPETGYLFVTKGN